MQCTVLHVALTRKYLLRVDVRPFGKMQGEVQVMLDLIDNVVGQQHVAFQACSASTDMESIALEWASRVANKTDQLQVYLKLTFGKGIYLQQSQNWLASTGTFRVPQPFLCTL